MNAQQQTFVGVQPSSPSQMLSPRVRAALEHMSLFIATTLFCFLVFMHAHYVKQPACLSEFSGFRTNGAKLMLIKITSTGLGLHNEFEPSRMDVPGLKTVAVQWLENKIKSFEPTYLYTTDKGYFLLPESAKSLHNIQSMNISISARHSCFGNRWQQLILNRIVGYDTVLINSLLSSPGQGFLYSYKAEQFYNLGYAQVPKEGFSRVAEKFVTKCGFLLMSFFVFFTTTMSASFILREAQSRMLKFAVVFQQLALQGLPTCHLFLMNGLELLVFVPIMVGILLFMFEFYHDQRLAFMVLALVWAVQLFIIIRYFSFFYLCLSPLSVIIMFTIIQVWLTGSSVLANSNKIVLITCSVRTPISMKFFPLFFFMYFLAFHMYFFFYPYGFSQLALITTGAFTLHLILYFWNRFEVPEFERLMMHILRSPQNQGNVQIMQSTIIASTVRIRRLDAGSQDRTEGTNAQLPDDNPEQSPGQAEPVPDPRSTSSFHSLLRRISEGSSSGLNLLFSTSRGQGQALAEEEMFSDAQE